VPNRHLNSFPTRRSSDLTRTLVIDEIGANAKEQRLRLRLAPGAQLVMSERDENPEDLQRAFKEVPIGLSDVNPGDFVVVELEVRSEEHTSELQSLRHLVC